jgi:hypothetical protein
MWFGTAFLGLLLSFVVRCSLFSSAAAGSSLLQCGLKMSDHHFVPPVSPPPRAAPVALTLPGEPKKRGSKHAVWEVISTFVRDVALTVMDQFAAIWKAEFSLGFTKSTAYPSSTGLDYTGVGVCKCIYQNCPFQKRLRYDGVREHFTVESNGTTCVNISAGPDEKASMPLVPSADHLKPDQAEILNMFFDHNNGGDLTPSVMLRLIRNYNDVTPSDQKLEHLRHNIELPTGIQISNFKQQRRIKKEKELYKSIGAEAAVVLGGNASFEGVKQFCTTHAAPDDFFTTDNPTFDKHRAYVVAHDVNEETNKCDVTITTWFLLQEVDCGRFPIQYHVDTTHNLTKEIDLPCHLFCLSDACRQSHPILVGYSFGETGEDTEFHAKTLMKSRNAPKSDDEFKRNTKVLGDAAEAGPNGITSAFATVFESAKNGLSDGCRLMCYPHVRNKVEDHLKPNKDEIKKMQRHGFLDDLFVVSHAPNKDLHDDALKLFIEKYEDPLRVDHKFLQPGLLNVKNFWAQPRVRNWFSGASPGKTMNQNGLESGNKNVKEVVQTSKRKAQNTILALEKTRTFMEERSLRYTLLYKGDKRLFVENLPARQADKKNRNITFIHEVKAYQFARNIPSSSSQDNTSKTGAPIFVVDRDSITNKPIYLTVSKALQGSFSNEKADQLYITYKTAKFATFDSYKEFMRHVYVIRELPDRPGFYICSCEYCAKNLWCYHTLVFMEKEGSFAFLQEAKHKAISGTTVKAKVGRPSKTSSVQVVVTCDTWAAVAAPPTPPPLALATTAGAAGDEMPA